VYDGTPPRLAGWDRLAVAGCRLDLRPLASRGSWAGRAPFVPGEVPGEVSGEVTGAVPGEVPGERMGNAGSPVLALTRARLRLTRAVTFWRAIDPVAAALAGAPGLLAAFGIGEAPLGWQGTVSVWRTPTDLVRFAYRHPEHQRAIERTATTGWYAEELFARFEVLDVAGDTEVIGWVGERRAPG
jgi:hypothetical protein